MLGDDLLEEDPDRSPKKDGVGHLHHGGLHVQREQGAFLLDDVQFVLEKGLHRGERQARSIEDFTCLQGQALFEHVALSIGCHMHHIDGGRLRQGDALLGSKEVAMAHAGHSGLAVALPCAHAMRVLLGIRLHGLGRTTVAVAFTQHRVHGGALHLVIALLDVQFLRCRRLSGVMGKFKPQGLKLRNGRLQLWNGGADVRKLHNIRFRRLGQCTKLSKRIVLGLFWGQKVCKCRQNAAAQRNVARLHSDIGLAGKRLNDRKKAVCRQGRSLVGKGVQNV